MNKQKFTILLVALAMMGGTAIALAHLKSHHRLGEPGVTVSPIPGSIKMNILLPELVLDYKSQDVKIDPGVFAGLPPDTSISQRIYQAPDGFTALVNVVLMGTDRTSIHKPQFCLEGSGWRIDDPAAPVTTVQMNRPYPYDLPVTKLTATREFIVHGQPIVKRGIFVYWFVADNDLAGNHGKRMLDMGLQLLRSGVLQRWAYVTCFAPCDPGKEDQTYERLQKFIRASVPEFQKTAGPRIPGAAVASVD